MSVWDEIGKAVFADKANWREAGGRRWLIWSSALAATRAAMKARAGDFKKAVEAFDDSYLRFQLRDKARSGGLYEEGGNVYELLKVEMPDIVEGVVEVPDELKQFIVRKEDAPKDYIAQELAGGLTDCDFIARAFATKRHLLIEGPTGVGKSTAVIKVLAEKGSPIVRVTGNERLGPEDLIGRWIPHNGGWKFVNGLVLIAARFGCPVVVEEVNMTIPSLVSFLNTAMDDTREVVIADKAADGTDVAEVVRVHPNFWVVGTMNRGYEGTRPLNKALARRFKVKLELGHPREAEKKLLPTWVRDLAERLRGKGETIRTPVTFGVLKDLRDNELVFGKAGALWLFINNFAPEERAEVAEVIFMVTSERVRYAGAN